MTSQPATVALVLDIDGAISPIDGPTAFGDDQIAGHMLGPVTISPTLARGLDAIASRPHAMALWLTSWPADHRLAMSGFPGRAWPDLKPNQPADEPLDLNYWWKPAVLRRWLDERPHIRRLVWCDDGILSELEHLEPLIQPEAGETRPAPASPHLELRLGNIPGHLIAPSLDRGLTPTDLERISALTDIG